MIKAVAEVDKWDVEVYDTPHKNINRVRLEFIATDEQVERIQGLKYGRNEFIQINGADDDK